MSERGFRGERRRHYRTRVPASWGLDVKVVAATGQVLAGELVDMSAGGAGVRLPQMQSPPLRAGDVVHLELRTPGSASPMRIQAVAQRGALIPHGYFYGFRFVVPPDLGLGTLPNVREAFNRRQMVRVRPSPAGSVGVTIAPLNQPRAGVAVSALDLSASGLAFIAAAQAHLVLGSHYDFTIEMVLPQVAEKLHLVAHVRYRVRVPNGWRYGVEFDRRRTEVLARQQALIASYVVSLLRDQSGSGRSH